MIAQRYREIKVPSDNASTIPVVVKIGTEFVLSEYLTPTTIPVGVINAYGFIAPPTVLGKVGGEVISALRQTQGGASGRCAHDICTLCVSCNLHYGQSIQSRQQKEKILVPDQRK